MSDKDKKGGRDKDEGDKPKDRRPPPERAGHVAPADPVFVEWLEKLWTRETPPTRLEVWWMVGTNGDVRRNLVFYENFRQPEKLDENWHVEHCARLAGEILRVVQDWTDSKGRKCRFEVAILDSYQQTVPLTKQIGPLTPKQAYAGVHPDGEPKAAEEDEEDDATIGIKPLTHKYLSKTMRYMHQRMNQLDAMMGDFMQLQQGGLVSAYSHNERLQNANMALYAQMQDASDRSLDREVVREKEKMKIKAIGSGLKVGQNLLYSWFGEVEGEGVSDGDKKSGPAPSRRHAGSREQRLVDSFLEECKDEKLSVQLFGDWQDTESLTLPDVFAGRGLKTPGIFTPQQFGIFLSVREGLLPPDALDALLPGSGKPQAITMEQMLTATPLLTEGMRVALQQLKQIRDEKREAQTAQLESGDPPQKAPP